MSTTPPPDSHDDEPVVPEFTPVPINQARHDGWSPERQRRFILALAAFASVNAAARAVGASRQGVYALRKRPGAESFAAAWDLALAIARERRFAVAFDRAVRGVTVPRFYRSQFVGTRHFHDTAAGFAALRDPPAPPSARPQAEQPATK